MSLDPYSPLKRSRRGWSRLTKFDAALPARRFSQHPLPENVETVGMLNAARLNAEAHGLPRQQRRAAAF